MTLSEKKLHGLLISLVMSLIVWIIIAYFLIDIAFWEFIIIEISIAIGQIFTTFIKEKLGIKKKEKSKEEDGL